MAEMLLDTLVLAVIYTQVGVVSPCTEFGIQTIFHARSKFYDIMPDPMSQHDCIGYLNESLGVAGYAVAYRPTVSTCYVGTDYFFAFYGLTLNSPFPDEVTRLHRYTCDPECWVSTLVNHPAVEVNPSLYTAHIYYPSLPKHECTTLAFDTPNALMWTYDFISLECWIYTQCGTECNTIASTYRYTIARKCVNASAYLPTTTTTTTTLPTTTTTLPTTKTTTTTVTSSATTSTTRLSTTQLTTTSTSSMTSPSNITYSKIYILPCLCSGNNTLLTGMSKEELVAYWHSLTAIDRKNTSKYQRRRTSAADYRASAIAMGVTGALTIAGVFSIFILNDVTLPWVPQKQKSKAPKGNKVGSLKSKSKRELELDVNEDRDDISDDLFVESILD